MNAVHNFLKQLQQYNQSSCRAMPSKNQAQHFTDDLINFLFPVSSGQDFSLNQATTAWSQLQLRFEELLLPMECHLPGTLNELMEAFFGAIPDIYAMLLKDAEAILRFDPAANS